MIAKLKSLDLFAGIGDSDLKVLSKDCTWQTVTAGKKLFNKGDPADYTYVVHYGSIKLVQNIRDDIETVINFFSKNSLIGAMMMTKENSVYPATAIALEDSGLVKVSRAAYVRTWMSHPELSKKIRAALTDRFLDLQRDRSLVRMPMQDKVADFLLRALESQPESFGNRISVRLTRQDIANRVGATVETIIRILSEWTKKGYISTHEHRIEILNVNALKKILHADSEQ